MSVSVVPSNLLCNYNDANRSYPEDYVGIFWLDPNNQMDQYGKKGPINFNPDKKSVIFLHGFRNGSISHKTNNYSVLSSNYSNKIAHASWLSDWNVGIFRWEPFADDDDYELIPNPRKTEVKIHVGTNLRYRNKDSRDFTTAPAKLYGKSISDMFIDEYKSVNFAENLEVRLVGHSLGCQLSLSVAAGIVKLGTNVKQVNRIELLDPYFCNGQNIDYISTPKSSAAMARMNLSIINPSKTVPSVPVCWYQCTNFTDFDINACSNTDMKKYVAWQGLKFWYLGDTDFSLRHCECISWYFLSQSLLPAYVYYSIYCYGWWNKHPSGYENALSATVSDDYIKKCMYDEIYWVQINNSILNNDISSTDNTLTTSVRDDKFQIIKGKGHCPDEYDLFANEAFSLLFDVADCASKNDLGDK